MAKKQNKKSAKKENRKGNIAKKAKPVAEQKGYWLQGLLATLFTFVVFFNTTQNEFVNWDDDRNFYDNELITSINDNNFWSQSKKIFQQKVIGNYNPLTIWTFALEKKFYGFDQPGKWHLTNVLLHCLCVLLVFKLTLLLGLGWRGALFVALLFGVHPMRVESVAWVTERKDVLFGVFYLAAMYLYTKGKINGKKYTVWIMLFFALSLFSKIQAVILPVSLVLIDYYFAGKLEMKKIVAKAPYFIIALLFGLYGIFALSNQGSLESNSTYPIWQRPFVGSFSYLVYLVKSVIPYRLSPLYPYPPSMPAYFYPTILAFPAVAYLLYRTYVQKNKVVFFGVAFFTANVFFLLQILGAGQGFQADRFTYMAYFGLFFMAGYGLQRLVEKQPTKQAVLLGIAALFIVIFSYMSFTQNKVWKNSGTLWSHVLQYYQNSTLPYGNRANYYRDNGEIQKALKDYSASINLDPKKGQAHNSRARLYFDLAKGRDTLLLALNDYNKAIELNQEDGEFYVNRGATHARLGNLEPAIADINRGLQLKPDHAVGYMNRSVLYNASGRIEHALADIEKYLSLKPYNPNLWYEKARALRKLGRNQESIPAYTKAIELKPSGGLFWYERSKAYFVLGNFAAAKTDLNRAKALNYNKLDPGYEQRLNESQ